MDQFMDRFAREGSMSLTEFTRALHSAGFNMWRTEIIAELSQRGFTLSNIGRQTWIVGLGLRDTKADKLRVFIEDNCIRADGLSCKLSAIVRGAFSIGLTRTEVIQQLQNWGFEVAREGVYVVRGLALREPEYA